LVLLFLVALDFAKESADESLTKKRRKMMRIPKWFFLSMIVSIMLITLVVGCTAPVKPTEAQPTAPPAQTEVPVAPTEEPAATEVVPTQAVPTEPSAEPKILRLRLVSDIENLDPAFQPTFEDEYASNGIMQPLVGYKPGTWELQNVLAEEIKQSEDGLTVEFKLKEGIPFHGGYGELTAEDVKFSYERIADPANESYYQIDWETLDHVEVTGTYTGKIILKEPFAPLWNSTLPLVSSWVISKKAFEDMGKEKFALHPIGTGPYEFYEWVPNQKIVLKRFKDYWGDPPEWDELDYLPIVEDSAAEIALETGEIDFGSVSSAAVDRFEADPNFTVYKVPSLDYQWLAINVQHPKLKDINVRRAIVSAVDVDSIIEAAFDNKWARACALIAPGQVGAWDEAPCGKPDIAKAKEYMQAAGLESLDLTLTIDDLESSRTVAEVIQANLAEIGINAEIIVLDSSSFWEGGMGEAGVTNRELTYVGYGTTPDPSWSTVWFTCDQVVEWNWMYWCNERYDELHEAAIRELDPDKRTAMYIEMQKLMAEDAIAVWITHPTMLYVSRADIVASISPHGRFMGWNFKSKE
jgi:peptide/nickel transport system substrate-binding protein